MDSLTKMQFLWTAAHEILDINPTLSSFYLSQIQSDKNVNISKSLIKRFCTHCSTLFIPGITCQVEIKTKKNKKNKEYKIKRKEFQSINSNGDFMDEDIPQPPCCQRNTCERLYYSLDERNETFQSYKYSNIIKYTCNICQRETIFNGSPTYFKLEKPSLETIDEEMEISLPNKFNNNQTLYNHTRNNSTSSLLTHNQNKSKKRKRNKNDLQQLLSKQNENKKPKIYSLNDFLSNL